MACTAVVTGDDLSLTVDLLKDGSPFAIHTDSVVEAMLRDGWSSLTDPVISLEAETGADWANSRIVVVFTNLESVMPSIMRNRDGILEVQVTDENEKKKTWIIEDLGIKKGLIS